MLSAAKPRLTVEYLPVDALLVNCKNPREHPHRQIKQLARSIEALGFNVPILVGRKNKVLAGHGRLLAAQRLGMTDVPVIRLEDLTKPQAKAFALAENRLQEEARWSARLLGEIFTDLAALDLSFSLEATGFSHAEIDLHIEGLSTSV